MGWGWRPTWSCPPGGWAMRWTRRWSSWGCVAPRASLEAPYWYLLPSYDWHVWCTGAGLVGGARLLGVARLRGRAAVGRLWAAVSAARASQPMGSGHAPRARGQAIVVVVQVAVVALLLHRVDHAVAAARGGHAADRGDVELVAAEPGRARRSRAAVAAVERRVV